MAFEIDFAEMDDVRARLHRDQGLVHSDGSALSSPTTGVPTMPGLGPGIPATGDAGADLVKAIKADTVKLSRWLKERASTLHSVIIDFRALDGAEGTRYDEARRSLAMGHTPTPGKLDHVTGGTGSVFANEEGGF